MVTDWPLRFHLQRTASHLRCINTCLTTRIFLGPFVNFLEASWRVNYRPDDGTKKPISKHHDGCSEMGLLAGLFLSSTSSLGRMISNHDFSVR